MNSRFGYCELMMLLCTRISSSRGHGCTTVIPVVDKLKMDTALKAYQ